MDNFQLKSYTNHQFKRISYEITKICVLLKYCGFDLKCSFLLTSAFAFDY